jgi:hypothetical protein
MVPAMKTAKGSISVRQTVGPVDIKQTGRIVVAVVLILGTCLERLPFSSATWVSKIGNFIALPLLPMIFSTDLKVIKLRGFAIWFGMLALLATLPSMVLLGSAIRLSIPRTLITNLATLLVTFALLRSMSPRSLRTTVRTVAGVLFVAAAVQAVLYPQALAAGGSRIAGFARPVLTFTEPTWLGIAGSLLFCAALQYRLKTLRYALGLLELVIFTRAAVAISIAGILAASRLARTKWFIPAVIGVGTVGSTYFTFRAMTEGSLAQYGSSLTTRESDILIVRVANLDNFFPLGGRQLSIFDPTRSRYVPTTSNNVVFDLWWKFGLAGLFILALWLIFLWYQLPRVAGIRTSRFVLTPAGAGLALLPAGAQFDNMFNRAWLWTLTALLLAVVCQEKAPDWPVQAELSPPSSRQQPRPPLTKSRRSKLPVS